MNKYTYLLFLVTLILNNYPIDGFTQSKDEVFNIKTHFPQYQNEYAYLATYYANDKKYIIDSGLISKSHTINFKVKKSAPGGIYLIIFPKKDRYIDILVDQKTDFEITIDTTDLPQKIQFKKSPINTLFYQYQQIMFNLQKEYDTHSKEKADEEIITAFQEEANKKINTFKDSINRNFKGSLLSKVFFLTALPPLSESMNELTPLEKYQYAKAHYWDGLSFNDQQLLHTPLLFPKLDNYFKSMVSNHPDSLWKETKMILDQVNKKDSTIYSFYLNTLLSRFANSQVMGQDKVFVNIFQTYLLDNKPEWMSDASYSKLRRGYYLAVGNIIGNQAIDINLLDLSDKKFNLYDIKAKYTVLCFWDPDCSHCKTTIPKLDSLLQNKWKNKDVKVIGVYVDGGVDLWKQFIKENELAGWYHGYQTEEMIEENYTNNRPSIQQSYNITATPVLYLLDKDKKIVAKNIDRYAVDKIIDYYEKKNLKNKLQLTSP